VKRSVPESTLHPVFTGASADIPEESGSSAARPSTDPERAAATPLDDARSRQRVEELFRAHGEFLRHLARRLCRSGLDPDDLVQDVFERTVLHAHALHPDTDHRAWLARVMRNLFIDRLRRLATRPPQDTFDDNAPATRPVAAEWWENLDADDIRTQLSRLSEDLRRAFELFAFEGCSYAEIADRLGIARMTVGTRIFRARQQLQRLFRADHNEGTDD